MKRKAPEDDDFAWNRVTKFAKTSTGAKKDPPIIIELYQTCALLIKFRYNTKLRLFISLCR